MFQPLYSMVLKAPKVVVAVVLLLTLFFASQMKMQWETDARVYMPKGHPAIIYDELVEEKFGAKDAIIIGVVNDEGVFNKETLSRIARITEKVAALDGVVANRLIDVASLSTASFFLGTETSIGAKRLMPNIPETEEAIAQLKKEVYDNADLFVGNLVSKDGKAAMIRAKLKEGIEHRYQTYWAIKGILNSELGESSWGNGNWSGNEWTRGEKEWSKEWQDQAKVGAQWGGDQTQGDAKQQSGEQTAAKESEPIKDRFYLAGRPVIEVSSGQQALEDLKIMIPLLLIVMAATLFLIFKTWRGVLLPMFVMTASVIWTMGIMGILGVPLYTISTMLPVILVVVGVGDAIHLLSHYYDQVLNDPQRDSKEIVAEVMRDLGAPIFVTSITTAVGFLSLLFAEMPPFKIFGIFTVVGIMACWLLSVTFIPAVLALLQPKVGSYLQKRQALRVHAEQSTLVKRLVVLVSAVLVKPRRALIAVGVVGALAFIGATQLYVNSSWMSDFNKESEIVAATNLINEKFAGTITLNIVVDGKEHDALKSPELLRAIEDMQKHAESLPYVGDSLSVVDYLKSMNKNLHEGQEEFNILPDSRAQIAEYLYLFSISGRPEELDEVSDFNYQVANVSIRIKSDQTKVLKNIIDDIRAFNAQRFKDINAEVNYAGSGNNSYVWADLLISSQTYAIFLSKLGIFLLATLLFRSWMTGLLVVAPVTMTTLLIAGASGFMGIPLDVSTVLAAGVAIGVGVDFAVHYIYRYRREVELGKNHLDATQGVIRAVGKTIVFNATVVSVGFAVLFLSQFPQHVKLGEFVAAYMVVSCIVALLLLPLLYSLPAVQRHLKEAK